nr:RNA polymerase I specific transcription initiation factor RRN3 [Hymenolepis microstoma]
MVLYLPVHPLYHILARLVIEIAMAIQSSYLSKAVSEHISGNSKNLNYFINKLVGADESSDEIEPIISEFHRIMSEIPLSIGELLVRLFTVSKPWYIFTPKISQKAIDLTVALSTQFEELAESFLSHICGVICKPSLYSDEAEHIAEDGLITMAFNSLRDFFVSMPHFEDSFVNFLFRSFPSWGRQTNLLFLDMSSVFRLCYASPRILSIATIEKIFFTSFDLLVKFETRENVQKVCADTIPTDLEDPFNPERFDEAFRTISSGLTPESNKHSTLFWLYCVSILKAFPKYNGKALSTHGQNMEWKSMCAVFRNLRDLFVLNILPLQSPVAVIPLLVTFMSSLHPSLAINFLENLWTFVIDTRQREEVQISCVRYLADYMAHFRCLSENVVIEQLQDFASWCVQYTYHRKGRPISHSLELMKNNHKLFYTIFESIVYIVTFRQAKLIGSSAYRARCTQIPLIQLISSPFKPLDAIEPSLRSNFLALSFAYKMNWTAVMLPNEYSSQVEYDPKPSFPCPLIAAMQTIPIAGHLDLFDDFVFAKRTQKRIIENGKEVASSNEESFQIPEKRSRYFNFKALTDLY